ncbi:transposase [Roseobacter cerasinus]|uniref:Transposase n=1 Tax=Roseobacter cerasinus TaxID=2602289 RepID=A0A640VW87_9RHOB|nr:transposase [Roseobacter cerasinus]
MRAERSRNATYRDTDWMTESEAADLSRAAMRFDMICEANEIEHRRTKPSHPWTNEQVERMNRMIKDATVKRYHCDTHERLRSHLAGFLDAYNFARRLKALRGLTPYEYICKNWTAEPD